MCVSVWGGVGGGGVRPDTRPGRTDGAGAPVAQSHGRDAAPLPQALTAPPPPSIHRRPHPERAATRSKRHHAVRPSTNYFYTGPLASHNAMRPE